MLFRAFHDACAFFWRFFWRKTRCKRDARVGFGGVFAERGLNGFGVLLHAIGLRVVSTRLIVDRLRYGRGAGADRQMLFPAQACQHVRMIGCEQEMKHRTACRRRDVHLPHPRLHFLPVISCRAQSADGLVAMTGNELDQSEVIERGCPPRIIVRKMIGECAAVAPK